MVWVIAILLALILVALMASDKSASAAVKKVLKIAILCGALLACAIAVLVFFVWFHLVWAKEDWWQTGTLLALAFFWLAATWAQRKELATRLKEDRRGTLVHMGKVACLLALGLLLGYGLKQILEAYELSGWWLIASGIAIPGVVLLTRTSSSPRSAWRDVWFDPDPLPSAWEVVCDARSRANAEEEALWDKEAENWHELDASQQDEIDAARGVRRAATVARLHEIECLAEVAKAKELANRTVWTVAGVFWTFVMLATLGLVPLYCHHAFEWAMAWKVVKGREWVAGAAVIGGGFAILGCLASVFEEVEKYYQGRRQAKDNTS